eukprot:3572120-Rhodomonas_salina.2
MPKGPGFMPQGLGFMLQGPGVQGSRVQGPCHKLQTLGFVYGSVFMLQVSCFRVKGPAVQTSCFMLHASGSRVQGPGSRVQGPGSR